MMRWPGTIKPGTIYNDIFSHYDLLPTFAAAGGDPDIVGKCLRGAQIGSKTFKVHLDGFDLTPFFKGEVKEAPRKGFLYWNDDGALVAVRIQDWKIDFKAQEHKGAEIGSASSLISALPSCSISVPIHSSAGISRCCTTSGDWTVFIIVPAQAIVIEWIQRQGIRARKISASLSYPEAMAKKCELIRIVGQSAFTVERKIARSRGLAVGLGRDDRSDFPLG